MRPYLTRICNVTRDVIWDTRHGARGMVHVARETHAQFSAQDMEPMLKWPAGALLTEAGFPPRSWVQIAGSDTKAEAVPPISEKTTLIPGTYLAYTAVRLTM